MRQNSYQPKNALESWGPPLVGVAGTVAAILTAFGQIGTELGWKAVLTPLLVALLVVGIGLLILKGVASEETPRKRG